MSRLLSLFLLPGTILFADDLTLHQNPTKSCGPQCCAFLDRYYGGNRSYAEIQRLTPASKMGTNLGDLAKTLRGLGYETRGLHSAPRFLRNMSDPAILAMEEIDGRTHFVVSLGYDKSTGTFLVYDPPHRLRQLTYSSLAQTYRGYALAVAPKGQLHSVVDEKEMLISRSVLLAVALSSVAWVSRRVVARMFCRRTVVGLLAFAGLSCQSGCDLASRKSQGGKPQLSSGRMVDLGDVVAGTSVSCTFVITNNSQAAFDITEVRKSCACETATVTKQTGIRPGDSVHVCVGVATSKGATGRFSRLVTLTTNAETEELRRIPLEIRGNSIRPINVIPQQVFVGEVPSGSVQEHTIRLEMSSDDLVDNLESIRVNHPALRAKYVKLDDRLAELRVTVAFEKECASGDFFGRVDLQFQGCDSTAVSIDIVGRVLSPLRIVPSALVLREFPDNWFCSVLIESTEESSFRITSVTVPEGVKALWETADGTQHTIDFRPHQDGGKIKRGAYRVLIGIGTDLEEPAVVRLPLIVN